MTESSLCPKCGAILPANAPEGICPQCLLAAGLQDSNSPQLAATTPQAGGFESLPIETIATLFPQLEIEGILGQGGMGTVYKARQLKLDRPVALKIIRPESAEDATFAERFNREARTLARLSHPHIVGIHDFGEVVTDETGSKLYYFVMEYVNGPNLRDLVQSQQLQPNQALAIVPQICDALQFAHSEGVVHRDIKPENILLDDRGRVKIADFGLAKLIERSPDSFTLTGTHQVMGTPRYMAPEQMEGSRTVDHRADIYSLGVVFYELLTGEVPLGQFDPPSVRAHVDTRLDPVILKALAREPDRRYQSVSELKQQVDAISSVSVIGSDSVYRELQPDHRAGASTIIEREAVAAWRWMVPAPASSSKQTPPEPPALLMMLLCLCGSLVILLPWIDVKIDGTSTSSSLQQVEQSSGIRTSEYLMTAYQEAPTPRGILIASGNRRSDVINSNQHTFRGVDKWPGIVTCACFSLCLVLLIALPGKAQRRPFWLVCMGFLAATSLIHVFVFREEVQATRVQISAMTLSNISPDINESQPYVLTQMAAASDAWADSGLPRLEDTSHEVMLQPGYYGSLGLSIAMLLFTATGIRHALSHETASEQSTESTGEPLTSYRCTIPWHANVTRQISFHFTALGYELVNEKWDAWTFRRGRRMAGLTATDIRKFDTSLTVRTMPRSDGSAVVSCLWHVNTIGAMISNSDIQMLEKEGHELRELLTPDNKAENQTPCFRRSIRG